MPWIGQRAKARRRAISRWIASRFQGSELRSYQRHFCHQRRANSIAAASQTAYLERGGRFADRRPRQLALCLAALAAGAALAVVVASAGADEPMTAGITAKDPYSFDNGSGGNSVSIAAGGTVTFSYPTGASSHNVVFDPAQPTSCHDIPPSASPPGWSR